MHEASIAMSIIEAAERKCREAGFKTIDSITVRIGNASGVLAEALRSAYEIVRLDTLASGAMLHVVEIPLGGICRGCGKGFTTEEQFIISCPLCGSGEFQIQTGREMEITEIEVN